MGEEDCVLRKGWGFANEMAVYEWRGALTVTELCVRAGDPLTV